MAIVKLKYTRGKDAIKAHVRYIVHRPGKDREKITRQLFSHNYQRVEKQRVYDRINAAPGNTLFFKFVINFHPHKEDTSKDLDLQHITSQTIRQLQQLIGREAPFVAAIHDDHTPLRHIHGIALVSGRLSKADFAKLRTLWQTATAEARAQRRMRERVRDNSRYRSLCQSRLRSRSLSAERSESAVRPLRLQGGCLQCGYGVMTGISRSLSRCPMCDAPLTLHSWQRSERLVRKSGERSRSM